jgi:hypothetical protein
VINAIRTVGVIILALLFLGILIFINVRKKKENQFSILLRIFTNYLHLISTTFAFSVQMPDNFTSVFAQVERVSSSNETFFSFDCFIEDYQVKVFAPSNSLFKLFLYFFLPIALIAGVGAVLLLMKAFYAYKGKSFDFRRALGVSMICIVFLFHPTITIHSLNVFQCNQIDENDSRMTKHLTYRCYSSEHLTWASLIGIPNLFVWVVGCPVFSLIFITRHRHSLEDWKIKKYFLILYQGLKPKAFYWEFFNTFRKVLILLFSVLLNSFSPSYRIVIVIGKSILTKCSYFDTHNQDPD